MGRPLVAPRAALFLVALRASARSMSRAELCAATGLDRYQAYEAIALLAREGSIIKHGNAMNRTYSVPALP